MSYSIREAGKIKENLPLNVFCDKYIIVIHLHIKSILCKLSSQYVEVNIFLYLSR